MQWRQRKQDLWKVVPSPKLSCWSMTYTVLAHALHFCAVPLITSDLILKREKLFKIEDRKSIVSDLTLTYKK